MLNNQTFRIVPLFFIALSLAASICSGQEPDALSERVVDYAITAELDREAWTLDCTETVSFLNTTQSATSELVFHLYMNGYANSESVHQKGSGWGIDFDALGEPYLGYIDIESILMGDGSPLASPAVIDDTLMSVPLARPLAPGERISLKIDFTVKFPHRTLSRSGFIGGHLWVGQWYPKLGVLEDAGWAAAPFYPHSEFYGPFGTFDVKVTLPAEFKVEATGKLLDASIDEENNIQTVRFRAHDVHDFAWVADTQADLPPPAIADNVEIVRFNQPYAEQKTEQITQTVRQCLALFADWYMPYPYERIVVAGGPHGVAAGMEYPGMINISFSYPTHIDWLAKKVRSPVGVTVHEFAHQYFYGIVASNEAADPWVDEGLTTYTTSKVMDEIYGPGVNITFLSRMEKTILLGLINDGFGLPYKSGDHCLARVYRFANLANFIGYDRSPFHGRGSRSLLGYKVDDVHIDGFDTHLGLWRKKEYVPFAGTSALTSAAHEFYPGAYHPIAYSKTALGLETLENHIGRDAMKGILKTFVEKFKFKHPRGADLLDALAAGAGPEHADLVAQLFTGTGTVDYAVKGATCRAAKEPVGFATQKAPGDEILYDAPVVVVEPPDDPVADGDADAEGDAVVAEETAPPAREYEWSVIVANLGEVTLPVDVEFCFDGGRTERRVFDGKTSFARFNGRSNDRLLGAVIDPEHKMALDLNLINNSRTVTFQRQGTMFLSGVAHFWSQNFLNGWAFFN